MKKIIVPTDFSNTAFNALCYAAEFSKTIKSEITLFHVYSIPVPATDVPIMFLTDKEMHDDAEKKLADVKNKFILKYPQIEIQTKAILGLSPDEIVDEVIDGKFDLIVMGTRGASGVSGFLVGTNTASVISNSVYPVIAVPENAIFNGLKKIVFAANYGLDDFENVFEVIDMARLFDAELILLHVSTGQINEAAEFAEIQGFKEQLTRESKYENISFILCENKNVYQSINLFLKDSKADMLVINKRNKSFLNEIFSKSLTKQMVMHTHVPMLVYHTDV